MLLLTVLSLAPAILLMTTSFVRIIVVLGLLRQALGTQQLPPSQVITSLALFMTLVVMTPIWNEVYTTSIRPYSRGEITTWKKPGTPASCRSGSSWPSRSSGRQQRRRVAVLRVPARVAAPRPAAGDLRRGAAASAAAGVHAQRAEDRRF